MSAVETDDAIRTIIESFDRIFVGVRRTVRIAAAALGPDVQPAAWPVFREVVRAERVQATTLVATLGMDKSAVSRHLKELREAGLVDAERDPTDARIAWLSPTPLAHERLDAITEAQRERLRVLFASWPADDVERFSALLARFSSTD
ncbi:MarR family transcriptional regulator [Amnibacterium kyonggiense]|uniref:MarR family transcriptional regulator n=1 Tax=Amnibacterium kyonggiense TaxID=595671 RepID=A0A4R7FLB0_9MICO|nr:MarR family transcriptional regulator [Amnibacterium kyonggiense]